MTWKQWWVSEQHIENQALVGFGTFLGERVSVAEVHRDIANLHPRARDLGPELHRDALIRLHPNHECVFCQARHLARFKQVLRGALEDDGNLGDSATEPFARSQIERNSTPASSVDVEPHCRECLGDGLRVHALFVEESGDLHTALPATRVLPSRGCG